MGGIVSSVCSALSDIFLRERPEFPYVFSDLAGAYAREIPDFPFERAIVAYAYSGNFVRTFHAFKFDAERFREDEFSPGIRTLSQMAKGAFPKNTIVTSPPSDAFRTFCRSYDPAEVLARSFARDCGFPYVRMFFQSEKRLRQSSLSARGRIGNVRGKFRIRKPAAREWAGRPVVFFDDVISSGATACECAELLRREGSPRVFWAFLASSTSA